MRRNNMVGIDTSGPGRVESDLSMKTKTHFAFRVDIWERKATASLSMSLVWTTSRWPKRPTGQPWRAGQRHALPYGRERGSCMRAGSMSPRNDHDGRADYSYLLQDPGKRQANHDDSTSQ
jgi:hypothetical protein